MLAFGWHWFTSWVIGWGGIGALVALAAWAIWFFCPAALLTYKTQLLHTAIGATIFALCSGYFYTSGYNNGYAVAMSAIAAQNKEAADAARKGTNAVNACFDSGGDWDVANGVCKH